MSYFLGAIGRYRPTRVGIALSPCFCTVYGARWGDFALEAIFRLSRPIGYMNPYRNSLVELVNGAISPLLILILQSIPN